MTTTFRKTTLGRVIEKDPAAVLDYTFDWSDWLDSAGGETISTYTVTVDNGLTKDSDTESGGKVTAWLSGGTAGTTYAVSCKVTTSAGRTDERRFFIEVKDR